MEDGRSHVRCYICCVEDKLVLEFENWFPTGFSNHFLLVDLGIHWHLVLLLIISLATFKQAKASSQKNVSFKFRLSLYLYLLNLFVSVNIYGIIKYSLISCSLIFVQNPFKHYASKVFESVVQCNASFQTLPRYFGQKISGHFILSLLTWQLLVGLA